MLRAALGSAVVAALTCASPASATCESARANRSVEGQPEVWRRAVEELVRAAAKPDHPWSCNAATIEVFPHEGGATLSIVDPEGRFFAREIETPDDVVPLGEALLSKPSNPPAPPEAQPPAPVPQVLPPRDNRDVVAAPKHEEGTPRALVSALIAPRYAGGSNVMWGGVNVAVLIPFNAWTAGLWGRYDGLATPIQEGPATSINEACIGLSVGRSVTWKSLELRPSFTPSVAIVTRGLGHGKEEETHVAPRLGFDLRGLYSITPLVRAVLAFDAELAPRELEGDEHTEHEGVRITNMPVYTLGLGLGMELALR